jgi:hypothetical protein
MEEVGFLLQSHLTHQKLHAFRLNGVIGLLEQFIQPISILLSNPYCFSRFIYVDSVPWLYSISLSNCMGSSGIDIIPPLLCDTEIGEIL